MNQPLFADAEGRSVMLLHTFLLFVGTGIATTAVLTGLRNLRQWDVYGV